MKLQRGDYPGASEFAYFDKALDQMTPAQMRFLLEFILHEASPGASYATCTFRALEMAEAKAREQGVNI